MGYSSRNLEGYDADEADSFVVEGTNTDKAINVLLKVWDDDPDALEWIKLSKSHFQLNADTVEVNIDDIEDKLDDVIALVSASKADYMFTDLDDSGDPLYAGYVDKDGAWYIMEFNSASGTARYVAGSSGYTTAWTGRAAQSYDYAYTTF